WWAIVAPLFVVVGAVFVVVGALLAPIGTHPIRDPGISPVVERLKQREGVPHTEIRVDKVSDETRAVNGETTGVGPTTVVILWDTLFKSHLSDPAIEFVTAHYPRHVARRRAGAAVCLGPRSCRSPCSSCLHSACSRRRSRTSCRGATSPRPTGWRSRRPATRAPAAKRYEASRGSTWPSRTRPSGH